MTKKKMIILGSILGFALLITGTSFYLGFRQQSGDMPEPTPTPTIEETPTPEETITEPPTPTSSPTPTKKPSPTPTKTPTPTITSIPTSTPTPTPQTITVNATSAMDGFQSSNGGGNAGLDIRVGRNATLVTRGFVSFPLSSIPSGATIEHATLKMYQTSVENAPYTSGGDVKIDHLNYGDSFDNTDYSISSLSFNFAIFSNNPDVGWRETEVTDRVREDRQNSRKNSQYRLHFGTESSGGTDEEFAHFESAENTNGSNNVPQLVIRYH